MKQRLKAIHAIIMAVLLVACGVATPVPTALATATSTPSLMPASSTPTIHPMASNATVSPSVSAILNTLRMVYIVHGNLYLQDGTKSPMQLTYSGEDLDPVLSEDGEKIVFYRGTINDDNSLHSINADGSQEQALVTNDWLTALGTGTKAGSLAFVPGTHQLLFNTYLCPGDLSLGCTTGLFLVDTDTGEIKKLLHPRPGGYLPFGGRSPWHGNFQVSPDGKLLSVAMSGHIDILSLDGTVVHRNIMTYTRTTPIELFPRVFWPANSRGLIVALPAENNYGGGYDMVPDYSVWRYDFDSNTATQIPLERAPMWIYMECSDVMYVSPDGYWIIFNRLEDGGQLYVGDLGNGHTRSYSVDIDCLPAYWSADSKYFVVHGHTTRTFLGTVKKPLIPVDGNFLGWVDLTHFIYSHFPNQKEVLVGEVDKDAIATYESGIFLQDGYDLYSFTFVVLGHKTNE